jgi:hypothetical protein
LVRWGDATCGASGCQGPLVNCSERGSWRTMATVRGYGAISPSSSILRCTSHFDKTLLMPSQAAPTEPAYNGRMLQAWYSAYWDIFLTSSLTHLSSVLCEYRWVIAAFQAFFISLACDAADECVSCVTQLFAILTRRYIAHSSKR